MTLDNPVSLTLRLFHDFVVNNLRARRKAAATVGLKSANNTDHAAAGMRLKTESAFGSLSW